MSSTFIAFDFGMTKMGVAIGQNITNTASPLDPMVMRNGSPDWDLVERLIKEYRPITIILGKPKVIDESSEMLMKKIKAFKRSLERDFSQNVEDFECGKIVNQGSRKQQIQAQIAAYNAPFPED